MIFTTFLETLAILHDSVLLEFYFINSPFPHEMLMACSRFKGGKVHFSNVGVEKLNPFTLLIFLLRHVRVISDHHLSLSMDILSTVLKSFTLVFTSRIDSTSLKHLLAFRSESPQGVVTFKYIFKIFCSKHSCTQNNQ